MVRLKRRNNGDVIHVHEDSVEFWLDRGFVKDEKAKPAPAKKAATRRSSSKK